MRSEKEIVLMSCAACPSRRFGQKYRKGFYDALKWVLEDKSSGWKMINIEVVLGGVLIVLITANGVGIASLLIDIKKILEQIKSGGQGKQEKP